MSVPTTVLVTGAAGFVAGHLARELSAAGLRVIGLDRARPPAGAAFAGFVQCDLLDDAARAGDAATPPCDAIVHLAGVLPGRSTRAELFAVNAGGTSAVLERFARPGTHVVLFSSGLVYGSQSAPLQETSECAPRDPYAQSKLAAETVLGAWARATGSPAAVLRPSVIYGPGAPAGMLLGQLLSALRSGEPFAMTAGEQLRDFLHVEDAARAVAALLQRRLVGTFNLASGESRSVRAAAELGAAIAGRPELLRIGALPYRDGEVFDYRLDNRALSGALDWRPRITLEDGLRRSWEEMS